MNSADKVDSYNLVSRPVVLAMAPGGTVTELSLRELVREAPRLAAIVGEVPSQAFAVLRFVLAIIHRSVDGPKSIKHWQYLREDWSRVVEAVDEYLDHFEPRFELFSAEVPFMQVPDLRSARDEVFGLERLIADVPTGNQFMTTRLGPAVARVTCAEAARWLLHAHAADLSGIKTGAVGDPRVKGGRGYPEGPGWLGHIGGVHLEGDSLADTLMLNLVARDGLPVALESGEGDVPVWERPPLNQCVDQSNNGEPRGFIDLYTWQSRRVRLVGDAAGVTGVVLSYGDKMTPQNRQGLEPMTAWRHSAPQTKKNSGRDTYMPREHRPERALWRGVEALLPAAVQPENSSKARATIPPTLLEWSAALQREGVLGRTAIRVRAVGIVFGPQQSTYAEILDDVIDLPVRTLADRESARVVVDAVRIAEDAAYLLGTLAQNLSYAGGASGEAVEGPRDRLRERAYAEFGEAFRVWLPMVASSDGFVEDLLEDWRDVVRGIARSLASDAIAGCSASAWRGHDRQGRRIDVGISDVWFHQALYKLLPVPRDKAVKPLNTLEESK